MYCKKIHKRTEMNEIDKKKVLDQIQYDLSQYPESINGIVFFIIIMNMNYI